MSKKITFSTNKAARLGAFGDPNATYHVICLGWHTDTYVKSLGEFGNTNDARNIEFANWVKKKLEEAQANGEELSFLRLRD